MLVLITGFSGFLGQHLVKELQKLYEITNIVGLSRQGNPFWDMPDKHQIKCWQCDLTDELQTKEALERAKPNIIFHFAANPIVKANEAKPIQISFDNILATHHLLEYCPQFCRFVFSSSATVYGDYPGICYESVMTNPTSVYGATKIASESLIKSYGKKISYVILRLIANVGHGAKHGVLPDLLKKIYSSSETFDILGDNPGSAKPYAYVKDTVKFAVDIANNPACFNRELNVGPCDTRNSYGIALQIMNQTNIYKPIKWLGESANWQGDNKRVFIDNYRAKSWGYKPIFDTSYKAIEKAIDELKPFYCSREK